MLVNIKTLREMISVDMDGEYSFLMKEYTRVGNTPLIYEGIYERIGYATLWNDFGGIEDSFPMYRPVGGGTILYEYEP